MGRNGQIAHLPRAVACPCYWPAEKEALRCSNKIGVLHYYPKLKSRTYTQSLTRTQILKVPINVNEDSNLKLQCKCEKNHSGKKLHKNCVHNWVLRCLSRNLSRNFVVMQVACAIAWCNVPRNGCFSNFLLQKVELGSTFCSNEPFLFFNTAQCNTSHRYLNNLSSNYCVVSRGKPHCPVWHPLQCLATTVYCIA